MSTEPAEEPHTHGRILFSVGGVGLGNATRCEAIVAALEGHTEEIEELLATGAWVEAQAVKKLAPLHAAARGGHPEAINLLLAAGADVNAQAEVEYTPLHAAATGGHAEAIKALVMAGA